MYLGKALFREGFLRTNLIRRTRPVPSVDYLDPNRRPEQSNIIQPLTIDFENPVQKIESVTVTVHDLGLHHKCEGQRIQRTFNYSGDMELFDLKPRRWWFNYPYATVNERTLTVGIESVQSGEWIERQLDRQVQLLRSFVSAQLDQVREYNFMLEKERKATIEYRNSVSFWIRKS